MKDRLLKRTAARPTPTPRGSAMNGWMWVGVVVSGLLAISVGLLGMGAAGLRSLQVSPRFPSVSYHATQETATAVSAAYEEYHSDVERWSRLGRAIRLRTVNQPGQGVSEEAVRHFHAFLRTAYPLAHRHLRVRQLGERGLSLLYQWDAVGVRAAERKPVLFISHLDVVPVDAATVAAWEGVQPFSGHVDGLADPSDYAGFIHGRGALDVKMGVLGLLETVELLLAAGFTPTRPIYLAFGHDEETGGHAGTLRLLAFASAVVGLTARIGAAQMAAWLQEQGVTFDFILDEGLPISDDLIPLVPNPIAFVGVAEKGMMNMLIEYLRLDSSPHTGS